MSAKEYGFLSPDIKLFKGEFMQVKDLKEKLEKYDDEQMVLVGDIDGGWANIDDVVKDGCNVMILQEQFPVFSDN